MIKSTRSVANVYDSFLTLLYPQACRLCERSVESHSDGAVCADCWSKTRLFDENVVVCYKCSAFLRDASADVRTFCHRCTDDFYDLARVAGSYEKSLLISVLLLKKQPFIPRRLENLIQSAFNNAPFTDATRIIPVPLSKKRLGERGFNQAGLIARNLSKWSGLPCDEQSLVRKIHTEIHRVGMDKRSREESVKKAFEVIYPRLIDGENIVLVDDVFTSGSTVSACAKTLKDHGAQKVYVFTIARVV